MHHLYPIFLNLEGKTCLVIGGGVIAAEKAPPLLHAGAKVKLVSPDLHEDLHPWRDKGNLVWLERHFQESDTDDAFMVIAATDDHELNHRVFHACEARNIPVNSVDDVDHCRFIVPSIARSGPVQVAVSTSGTSPTLARRLRMSIQETYLSPETGILADFLGSWRPAVARIFTKFEDKKMFWKEVFASDIPKLVTDGRLEEATREMQVMLATLPGEQASVEQKKPSGLAKARDRQGSVFLVGAGPGAPDLLTVRAVRLLEQAEVVLYDRLVDPAILKLVTPSAEKIYVGKNRGEPSGLRQRRIHTLMIGHARAGRNVVRLKGGDPYVFGRGGEEMLSLAEAGIEVEVVPGISSSITAPALANIPVTHRGLANSFAVFAGHPGEDPQCQEIDWQAAARVDTAVFLMGVSRLPIIVGNLLRLGRAMDTPIALIEKASRENQKVVTGTLGNILDKAADVKPPATIVVGEVVNVREMVSDLLTASRAEALYEFAS